MTTIVFRDGVMASDTRAYSGGNAPIGRKVKIKKLEDGALVGVSSTTPGLGELLIRWIEKGADEDVTPTIDADAWFEILMVKPGGEVFYSRSQFFFSGPLEGSYFAIGSGSEYAKGALAEGASAERAVRVATMFDPYSEAPLTTLHL